MSKLREKFGNVILNQDHNEKCEQITNDFTVKFYDWANINAYKYPTKTTTTELLQIFKDKYYE